MANTSKRHKQGTEKRAIRSERALQFEADGFLKKKISRAFVDHSIELPNCR